MRSALTTTKIVAVIFQHEHPFRVGLLHSEREAFLDANVVWQEDGAIPESGGQLDFPGIAFLANHQAV